jgi:hypothetical protein
LGFFGAANSSVYSGPPVGQGAGSGAQTGAMQGASVGSAFGPIGSVVGAAIGAIGGAIAGSINKKDPEQYNFDQAVAIWQANRLNVLNIANKYLPLAGLFDLNIKTNIPIYKKYGHMGEEHFLSDFANLISAAAQSGKITASDTPQTIMVKVVQPWVDSWGFGPMADPHQDLINLLLLGLIADYVDGSAPKIWRARSGDLPAAFAKIPPFSLPGGTQASAAVQYAPTSAVTSAPLSVVTTPSPSSSSAAAQPPQVPAQILTGDGAQISSPGVGLRNAAGQVFQLGPQATNDPGNPYGYPVWIGNQHDGYLVGMTLVNGQVYGMNGAHAWYQWAQGTWQTVAGPPQQTAAAPATTSASTTAVAIPAGFTLIGAANGMQAYQGVDGLFYSWNGVAMTPLTGTLTLTSGQSGQVVSGQVQAPNAPASTANLMPTQQAYYSAPDPNYAAPQPPPSYAAAQPPSSFPGNAPAQPVQSAGVGGLPSWVTWGAVGSVVYLMFATARPEPLKRRRRK